MRVIPPLLLALVMVLLPTAAAWTLGPSQNIRIYTHAQGVEWRTNDTVETNSIKVNADGLIIGSRRIDIIPDGAQRVRVHIELWNLDLKRMSVIMTAGNSTGLNLTYSNPGVDLRLIQGGIITHTCAAAVSLCTWTLTNATKFNFTIATPTGVEQLGSGAGLPPLDSSGSAAAGGAQAPAPVDNGFDLPNPIDLFPRFTALRWFALLVSGILLFNGMTRVRRILPLFLRLRGKREGYLFIGSTGLALVYFAPI